jgi:hypothetical protein
MTRRAQAASFLMLIISSLNCAFPQGASPSENSKYYPLAKGNVWKYQVKTASSAKSSTVEWRVTSTEKDKEGVIYQVWPKPSHSDDEAMMLVISPKGIEETSIGVLVPKSPVVSGERWISTKSTHRRAFRVLSVGQPCHAGIIASEDCLSVEDEDDGLRFRTVTTYAKGIGPIRYEYFRKNSTAARPIQTVELLSYHLGSM